MIQFFYSCPPDKSEDMNKYLEIIIFSTSLLNLGQSKIFDPRYRNYFKLVNLKHCLDLISLLPASNVSSMILLQLMSLKCLKITAKIMTRTNINQETPSPLAATASCKFIITEAHSYVQTYKRNLHLCLLFRLIKEAHTYVQTY